MEKIKNNFMKVLQFAFWLITVLSFMLGVSGSDSFMENGQLWLLCLLIFAPFLIGYIGVKHFNL